MKNWLIGIILCFLFFCIIYGLMKVISYSYFHFNIFLSLFIDFLVLVVVIYVIEFLAKKIDQLNNYDE